MSIGIGVAGITFITPTLIPAQDCMLCPYSKDDLEYGSMMFEMRITKDGHAIKNKPLDIFLVSRNGQGKKRKMKPVTYRGPRDWWFGRKKIVTGNQGDAFFELKLPPNPTRHYLLVRAGDDEVRIDFISDSSRRDGMTHIADAIQDDDDDRTPEIVTGPIPPPARPMTRIGRETERLPMFRMDDAGKVSDLPDIPSDIKLAQRVAREARKMHESIKKMPTPEPGQLGAEEFDRRHKLMWENAIAQGRMIDRLTKALERALGGVRDLESYRQAFAKAETDLREIIKRYNESCIEFDRSAHDALTQQDQITQERLGKMDILAEEMRVALDSVKNLTKTARQDLARDHRKYMEEMRGMIKRCKGNRISTCSFEPAGDDGARELSSLGAATRTFVYATGFVAGLSLIMIFMLIFY
jgi:hypothetical protein